MINPISDLALVLASTLTYILTHCGKYLYYISSQKAIVQRRSVRYVCSADQSKSVINAYQVTSNKYLLLMVPVCGT